MYSRLFIRNCLSAGNTYDNINNLCKFEKVRLVDCEGKLDITWIHDEGSSEG
jgi:hypothetical protein